MEVLLTEPRMSTVNLAEVVTKYVLRGRAARGERLRDELPVVFVPVDEDLALQAALMAAVTKPLGLVAWRPDLSGPGAAHRSAGVDRGPVLAGGRRPARGDGGGDPVGRSAHKGAVLSISLAVLFLPLCIRVFTMNQISTIRVSPVRA